MKLFVYTVFVLLAASAASAYHGGLTYNDYGAHYGTYNYDRYDNHLWDAYQYDTYYDYAYRDPYYGSYYPAYNSYPEYHQRVRYNEVYNQINGNYPQPRITMADYYNQYYYH